MTTNTASPIGGLMTAADSMSPTELVDHARRLEQLGYPSVWLTDVFGRDVYVTAAHLLANTDTIDVASSIYIAAHGPKMMAVAAEVADGANTYMQPPEHSRQSRATLGPDKALNVVLPSCLTTDPEQGRTAGRRALSIYLPVPAYQRQWANNGFTEEDWSSGGSDRLAAAFNVVQSRTCPP